MTLLDINNQLIEFFLNHEKFNLDENLDSIKISESYIEHTKALVISALNSLVNKGMLVKLDDKNYLLTQPINNFSQSITISPNIASAIADKVNMIKIDEDDESGDVSNQLNLGERDIVKLLIIIDMLLEETGDEGMDE